MTRVSGRHRRPRHRRWIPDALAVTVTLVGAGLVWTGVSPAVDVAAPLPTSPFGSAAVLAEQARPAEGAQSDAATPPEPRSGVDSDAEATTEPSDPLPGPTTVSIPSLSISAPWVPTRFRDGRLAIPDDPMVLGMAADSAALAARAGTTLLVGHVSMGGVPGALHPLASLEPGATIQVTNDTGLVSTWIATDLFSVAKTKLPAEVWDTTGPRRLALVTCGGPVVDTPTGRRHRDNVIVYAAPAPSHAADSMYLSTGIRYSNTSNEQQVQR